MEKSSALTGDEEQGKENVSGWEISESKAPRDEEQQQEKEVVVAMDFPEGGWRAYGAVTGAVLVLLSTFGFVVSFTPSASFFLARLLTLYATTVFPTRSECSKLNTSLCQTCRPTLLQPFRGSAAAISASPSGRRCSAACCSIVASKYKSLRHHYDHLLSYTRHDSSF